MRGWGVGGDRTQDRKSARNQAWVLVATFVPRDRVAPGWVGSPPPTRDRHTWRAERAPRGAWRARHTLVVLCSCMHARARAARSSALPELPSLAPRPHRQPLPPLPPPPLPAATAASACPPRRSLCTSPSAAATTSSAPSAAPSCSCGCGPRISTARSASRSAARPPTSPSTQTWSTIVPRADDADDARRTTHDGRLTHDARRATTRDRY